MQTAYMKEKFRLRCDLNTITDIEEMDKVAENIEQYNTIKPYHRYSYLFRWYKDLTSGAIDEETFFTLGDITSHQQLFDSALRAWLETLFMIEDEITDNTLYIVEQSAWEYYLGKVWHDRSGAFRQDIAAHWSALLVI